METEMMKPQQNKAVHLWFRWIAMGLRDIGYDMREVKVPIPPTPENVKELARQVILATNPDKYSSTQWNASDVEILQDAFARALAEHELQIPFPCEADMKKQDITGGFL